MKKIIYFILVLFSIFACGKKDKLTEKEKQVILQNTKKEKIISELTNQYNISYMWDTLNFKFSIEYDKIIRSNYQLIDDMFLNDIYQKDTIYYFSLKTRYWPKFYFDLSISENELNKILKSNNLINKFPTDIILVVKIIDIKKFKFRIAGYPEDEYFCYLEFETSSDFIGKGEIIELIIIN